MVWLFGQVWVLLLVAFLLGALLTWVAFVVPLRRAAPRTAVSDAVWTPPPWYPTGRSSTPQAPVPESARVQAPAPPRIPDPADSALAELDQHRIAARRRSTGTAAAGALDDLAGDGDAGPNIPRQTRPDQS
jgi:cytoskeletal protein RodZ